MVTTRVEVKLMSRKLYAFLGVLIFSLILLMGLTANVNASDKNSVVASIARNGHFTSAELYLYEGDKVEVDVHVTLGGPVDVYLMTEEQYNLAYNLDNKSAISVGYLKGVENSKDISFSYKYPDLSNSGGSYYYIDSMIIVIDNRNCSLTNYDADSTGIVEVTLTYSITSESLDSMDEFALVCVGVIIVIVIIIVIIIFYFVRESRRKTTQPAFFQQAPPPAPPQVVPPPQPYPQYPQYSYPYYYQYQYQYPSWPPYGPPPMQQPGPQQVQQTAPSAQQQSQKKTKKTIKKTGTK